jgi:tRNA-binding EMAP/Myf-like protein
MRARNYRGQRSHGMLCSLEELGWLEGGPNEVAILQNLTLGKGLDDISSDKYAHVVVEWDRAREVALAAMVDRAVSLTPPENWSPDKATSRFHQRAGSGSWVATGS